MASARVRVTVAQPEPIGLNGRTTLLAGAVPASPIWMWAAVGAAMSRHVIVQQIRDWPGLTVMTAVPLPSGSPAGISAAPVRLVLNLIPPWAGDARAAEAIRAADAVSEAIRDLAGVIGFSPLGMAVGKPPSRRSRSRFAGAIACWISWLIRARYTASNRVA